MLNASLLWSCAGLLFKIFQDYFSIFVMFVNLDISEIVIITSESTDYEFFTDIFIELLKFFLKC